jgi:high-affinity iron transporter
MCICAPTTRWSRRKSWSPSQIGNNYHQHGGILIEAFIITLREGIEAVLVVSLILIYLNRTGQQALIRYVYLGIGLAVVASVVGAIGFSFIGLDPESAVLEGILLAVAAVLVTTMVIWMWRTSQNIKQYIETQLQTLTETHHGWGLLGFTFFMVFREGVELVLFLATLSLVTGHDRLQLIGGVTGLGLAILLGWFLVKGSVRLNLRLFFGLTGLVLVVLVVRFVAGSIHEFAEAGFLPETLGDLPVITFIIHDSTSLVTLLALVSLPFTAMLPGLRRRPKENTIP